MVIDAQTGELLYLEKGKKKEQLEHFFTWVGDDFMSHVKAISMDMNTNYSSAVKNSFPHIQIVYDTFHIVKWFNDQVIDAARRTEGNRLKKLAEQLKREGRTDESTLVLEERKLLFGSRFCSWRTQGHSMRRTGSTPSSTPRRSFPLHRMAGIPTRSVAEGLTMPLQELRSSRQTAISRMR